MNGFQNGKNFNIEKPIPGCLGRMVNLFDLSTMSRNRLLTDKPHYEGSPFSRSQSDVARTSPSGGQIEDEVIMSEFRRTSSNKKLNGTPMKMLIDQEMSKEIDYVQNPPSVVAKLMGLDPLPLQQSDVAAQRSHSVAYSRSCSDAPSSYWKDDRYVESERVHRFDRHPGQKEYKDIYEIWQQSRETNCIRDKSPSKGRYVDSNDKKMALVRQKFMEAKSLATDEKLRQSKEFQDALDVLSSNKDSFLKFLQEKNSLFSQHLSDMQSIPPPPSTKRITVLRPSKIVESSKFSGKNEKYPKKSGHVNGFYENRVGCFPQATSWKVDENPTQPTRIVVLKPGIGKNHDIQAMSSLPSASPRTSRGSFGEIEHDVSQESRKVAKSTSQRVHENIGGHQIDETLPSSVFSNGYIGDESSFNKSEAEYVAGNLSDSDVMSPSSRHSWDYINRLDSPYSLSFSRASYSPESSVGKEAKKRLSERWAMMASNGSYQAPKHVRRSSSTLGEMLALTDVKKAGDCQEESIDREESRASSSFLYNNLRKDEGMDNSPKNLLRSRSVPVSSTVFGMTLNGDIPDPKGASEILQDATKARNSKSSFRGRVSSLFFSRNKKTDKGKPSQLRDESSSSGVSCSSFENINDQTEYFGDPELKCSSVALPSSSCQASFPRLDGKQSIISPEVIQLLPSPEAGSLVGKPLVSGNTGENQDQPSPISVLEPPFEEDEHTASESSYKADPYGLEVSAYSNKSNLIDKSPPIGSIARTLSWDDACVDTASSYPLKPSLTTREAEEEEEEWLFFIQTLLSVAGLDGEVQSDAFMARWHSPESPLDPSLRDKYIDLGNEEVPNEAKRRQKRSTQKLVFDCVNAAMIHIAGYGSDTCQRVIPDCGSNCSVLHSTSFKMADQVLARMTEWFSGETRCFSGDSEDNNGLVVEMVVRKEVAGKGWVEHLRVEVDNFCKEIEEQLVEELLQEAVIESTVRG